MKKRIIAGLLAGCMAFSMVGCEKEQPETVEEILSQEVDDMTWDIFRLEQSIPYNCTVTQHMDTYAVSLTYCDDNASANYAVFDEEGNISSAFDFVTIGTDMYAHCYAEGTNIYMHAPLTGDEDMSMVMSSSGSKIDSDDIISIDYGGESTDKTAIYVNTEEISEDGETEYFTYVINKKTNLVETLIQKDAEGNALNTMYIEPANEISYDSNATYEEVDIYTILWEMVAWMLAYTTGDEDMDGEFTYEGAESGSDVIVTE